MLKPKAEDWPLVGAAVLLVTLGLLAWVLSSFGTPLHEQCANEARNHQAYKECVEILSAEAVAYYTKWLAGLTAVLAVFTILLAGAGIWQGKLARDEFNATHRPLLVVRSIDLNWDEKKRDRTSVFFSLINEGMSDAVN